MVNNFLFCVCVCVLQVTWRANGIVLYMYEGNVLMDIYVYSVLECFTLKRVVLKSFFI